MLDLHLPVLVFARRGFELTGIGLDLDLLLTREEHERLEPVKAFCISSDQTGVPY